MKITIHRVGDHLEITEDGKTRYFIGDVKQDVVGEITLIEFSGDEDEIEQMQQA